MEKTSNITETSELLSNDDVIKIVESKRIYLVIKRGIDIMLSIIALVLLFPLFVIIAIIIKFDSKGKVFFTQERTGLNRVPFKIYKFRSMAIDAESKRNSLITENKMDGPVFKVINDPRVTKFGKFIRKTSLDELPQLFNILKGDMSIIGPRPLVTYETKDFNTYQNLRHAIKPGLSCYWQVSGRNDISFEEWMKLDIEYIKKMSILTDIVIIIKTIKIVILGIGAY